ncbi:MAG: UDP-N-acetylmuramate dehydrogenase [Fimbriiglobus sp.]|nr:UDP-N-acetylmuramate dehydrogenase [Fimbriiglobus sp.]
MPTVADAFPEIVKTREPLAPYTHLKIGGPAEYFAQPRTVDELACLLKFCTASQSPVRMLGGGYNLLIRDDPVSGVVVRLHGPAFSFVETTPTGIRCGGGTPLFELLAHSVKAGLGGLETLVGLRGTVGGSVRCNVGDKNGEIGACVRRVVVLHDDGTEHARTRDQLTFGDHSSDLTEPVILSVEFDLHSESPAALLKRMRRAWVSRKSCEPLSFQSAVRMFRNPPGQDAGKLIDKAGLSRYRFGGAEVSERNPNYAIAHPGTTARDIMKLLDSVATHVKEFSGVELRRELNVW